MCKNAITLLMLLTVLISSESIAKDTLAAPSVRLVYFLPKDRRARPERIEALRQMIKDAQEFYADEMERHGFGRKTFRVETDSTGDPVVHHVAGQFNDAHYLKSVEPGVWREVVAHFEDVQHVYFIAIDQSSDVLGGESCGVGAVSYFSVGDGFGFTPLVSGGLAVRHRDITPGTAVFGGYAILPASGHCFEHLGVTLHELGHTFGLEHDFREGRQSGVVMAFGNHSRLSACAAEWLSVSRFFRSTPVSADAPGNIQLISTPVYSPEGIRLRFKVTDANGLHQAHLLVPEIYEGTSWGPNRLFDCKRLDGKTRTVEFISQALIWESVDRIALQIIDVAGHITWAMLPVDISSLIPPPKVVSIPDRNLAAAIRTQLGLAPRAPITDRAMQHLIELDARERRIKTLTGLEHATQLVQVSLFENQIQSLKPLAGLTQLRRLYLQDNRITDITPLAKLAQLRQLHLWGNRIRDVSALSGLTRLESLWLESNEIRDITPLAGLAQLTDLKLGGNPIQDMSPLQRLLHRNPDMDLDIGVIKAGRKIEGPWLWMIAPTQPRAGGRVAWGKDWLAIASNGAVTEAQIATNGAIAGEGVQDRVWTLGRLAPTGGNNLGELMNTIGFGEGSIDDRVAYGSIVFQSPRAQKTWMYAGSDDTHKVWLNGEVVSEQLDYQWADDYQESFRVTLKQGKNVLLVAIENQGGPWGGYLGFEKSAAYSLLLSPTGHIPPTPPVVDVAADVNRDTKVNKNDLLLVVTALGEKPPANPNFDVNADGVVNMADVLLVIEALDDPGAAAAPSLEETALPLDAAVLSTYLDGLRAESDGSPTYTQAIAFFEGLLTSMRPTETQLLANYPNPFNPETWIPYRLAEDMAVHITIYNPRGGVIRSLSLGPQSAGDYTAQERAAYWDGRNALGEQVASGIYFYTLSAGDFTATRKLLIRK